LRSGYEKLGNIIHLTNVWCVQEDPIRPHIGSIRSADIAELLGADYPMSRWVLSTFWFIALTMTALKYILKPQVSEPGFFF
jgi:hypothetical protein